MSKYKIGIAYEEGFTIEIEAASQQEAEQKALEIVGEHADATSDLPDQYVCKTVHRDYFTA
jgi:hypothetical protein